MDLKGQLSSLYSSLGEYKPTDDVSDSVGDVFDALVTAAKAEMPGNPVVDAVKPTKRGQYGGVIEKAGDLRLLVMQLMRAQN